MKYRRMIGSLVMVSVLLTGCAEETGPSPKELQMQEAISQLSEPFQSAIAKMNMGDMTPALPDLDTAIQEGPMLEPLVFKSVALYGHVKAVQYFQEDLTNTKNRFEEAKESSKSILEESIEEQKELGPKIEYFRNLKASEASVADLKLAEELPDMIRKYETIPDLIENEKQLIATYTVALQRLETYQKILDEEWAKTYPEFIKTLKLVLQHDERNQQIHLYVKWPESGMNVQSRELDTENFRLVEKSEPDPEDLLTKLKKTIPLYQREGYGTMSVSLKRDGLLTYQYYYYMAQAVKDTEPELAAQLEKKANY